MITTKHANPMKSLGFSAHAGAGAKFDRTHTFCHIIALRSGGLPLFQASDSGAKKGQTHTTMRPSLYGRPEGIRIADTIVASPSPSFGVQPMCRVIQQEALRGLNTAAGKGKGRSALCAS
jgi:hypothetical protein